MLRLLLDCADALREPFPRCYGSELRYLSFSPEAQQSISPKRVMDTILQGGVPSYERETCIAMDDADNDELMSESQVDILKAEIRASVRTAQIILGSIMGAIVAVMTTFGVIFYQQGLEERDGLMKLTQRFEDIPKPTFDINSTVQVNTERILALQKWEDAINDRMTLQGNVMRQLQDEIEKLEKQER